MSELSAPSTFNADKLWLLHFDAQKLLNQMAGGLQQEWKEKMKHPSFRKARVGQSIKVLTEDGQLAAIQKPQKEKKT